METESCVTCPTSHSWKVSERCLSSALEHRPQSPHSQPVTLILVSWNQFSKWGTLERARCPNPWGQKVWSYKDKCRKEKTQMGSISWKDKQKLLMFRSKEVWLEPMVWEAAPKWTINRIPVSEEPPNFFGPCLRMKVICFIWGSYVSGCHILRVGLINVRDSE